jgi:hypothetical protein
MNYRIGDLTFNQIDSEEFFHDNNLLALFYYIENSQRREFLSNVRLFSVLEDWFDNYLDLEVYQIWKERLEKEYKEQWYY